MAVSTVTIGVRSSLLSSSTVFAVASRLSTVTVDSSVLDRLSHFQLKKPSVVDAALPRWPFLSSESSESLTVQESRATLLILLNRLCLFDSGGVRTAVPILIQETLNKTTEIHSYSSVFEGVAATKEEKSIFEDSLTDSTGILAILDCCSSALVPVCDAVAALSCEVISADSQAFDAPLSGDSVLIKDEVEVASDMRDLLFGSKFAGRIRNDSIMDIPEVHGSFRSAVRAVHTRARAQLNLRHGGKGKALIATVLPLAMTVRNLAEISCKRAELLVSSFHGKLQEQARELFELDCVPRFQEIMTRFRFISVKADSEPRSLQVLHELNASLDGLRSVLAWEAALALYALELHSELNDKIMDIDKKEAGQEERMGEKIDGKRNEKKKKMKALGKGTAVIRKFLKDKVTQKCGVIDHPSFLVHWASRLAAFFVPEDPELLMLANLIKEIVESNDIRRLPKIPKGTRDFGNEQMAIRERAYSLIVGVFKRHGASALETPVFELRETLTGKYGEDSKLIYDLADQGGELCSLRYDLTVPFARYLAMNKITSFKRYQIGRVYRRDNPSKGRLREFYQGDFDIAGKYEMMEPDFEVIKVLTELLDELNIGAYEIKLNHRKLLDGMLAICGVPAEKFRPVCSSIDKLDKISLEQVKRELVNEKGLATEIAEQIGSFVKQRGPPVAMLSGLNHVGSRFLENEGSVKAMKELDILFRALEKSNCIDKVIFDLSLARGLDYYTGVIFEAVLTGSSQVGSVAAGGRYDNLVKMFGAREDVPAVGVSVGIERVYTIIEEQFANSSQKNQMIRATETQVLVVFVGKKCEELMPLAAELASEIWRANIKAEFAVTSRVMKQIDRAKQSGIPFMVIVGEMELRDDVANLKDIGANQEEVVSRNSLLDMLQRRLKNSSVH